MTPEQIAARLQEIAERRQAIGEEFRTLNDEAGDSPLEGEQAERWAALETEDDTLTAEVADLEKRRTRLEAIERAAQDPANVSPGSVQPPNVNTRTSENPYDVTSVRSVGDAREVEMRGRALEAVERASHFVGFDAPEGQSMTADEIRERVTRLIERSGGKNRRGLAEQVLTTMDPLYRDAFYKAMAGEHWRMTPEERDKLEHVMDVTRAMALSDVTGVLVPAHLDPTVILTNDGTINPFRARCRVESITTNVWTGVSSAGITAGWTGAEGTEVGDDAPSFANPAVTAHMADAFVPISYQAYDDLRGGESEIVGMLVDAKDRLESTAHAVGSGSDEPTGLVTALDANTNVEVATTTSNVFGLVDVYGVYEQLPARWRPRAEWFGNLAIENDIRQFGTDSLSTQTVDLTADGITRILGKRFNEAEEMDGAIGVAGTDNILVIGDPRNYLIADRVGFMVEFVPNLFGTTNARPTLQRGWIGWWRTGGDSVNDLAFRLLQAETNS